MTASEPESFFAWADRTVDAEEAQNTSGLGEAGQNFAGDPDAAAAHFAAVTRAEALCHAAWLVAIADDDDEFPAILAAVRST